MERGTRAAAVLLSIALGAAGGVAAGQRPPEDRTPSRTIASKRMADGKEWTTTNLNVDVQPSYCYGNAAANCRRYGRLYPWAAARRACRSLGDGWHLPSDAEWRQLARRYGGVIEDSADEGRAAFIALLAGGTSGFNAVFGGNRSDGQYARLEEHGFYWSASDDGSGGVPFYNFGRNGHALNRQPQGDKEMAISVRCVRR